MTQIFQDVLAEYETFKTDGPDTLEMLAGLDKADRLGVYALAQSYLTSMSKGWEITPLGLPGAGPDAVKHVVMETDNLTATLSAMLLVGVNLGVLLAQHRTEAP